MSRNIEYDNTLTPVEGKRFKRKDGFPTAYAFRCGYGVQYDTGTKRVSLYFNNGSYEVKAVNWAIAENNDDARVWAEQKGWNDPHGFRFWENYTTGAEAIKAYRAQYRKLFKGK